MTIVDEGRTRGFRKRELDPGYDSPVRREHLLTRMSVEEIERANIVRDPHGAAPELPFGHLNAAWRRFAAQVGEGDEVWSFSMPWERQFPMMEMRRGYVVVRDADTGACFLTVWRKEFDAETIRARAAGSYAPKGKSGKRAKRGG